MKSKLHLIAVPDSLREVMGYAYMDKNDTVVTDAHRLIVFETKQLFDMNIDIIGDDAILIPHDCLKQMNRPKAKYNIKKIDIDYYMEININNNVTIHPLKVNERDLKFPVYKPVIPTEYNAQFNNVGFSPKLLYEIAQAVDPDAKGVELKFFRADYAMGVRVMETEIKHTAILMPRMII
jgi:hypothetical protein